MYVLVDLPVGQQQVGEAVEHGDVGAGTAGEVDVGDRGELSAPRVDHHQPCSASDQLLQPGADDRMRLGGVGSHHQDAVGTVEVLEGSGTTGQAEGRDQAGRGRRMAEPGAVVDVVGPDHGPHHLLQQIVLLVRRPGRGDGGHRLRSVLVADAAEFATDHAQRLVPAGWLQLTVPADQRRRQPVLRADESVREPTLDACVAPVDRTVQGGRHRGDHVVAHVHVQGASHPAVPAGRAGRRLNRPRVDQPRLRQGPGRAGVDAAAAAHAGGVDPQVAGAGGQDGLTAATAQAEREGALHLVAHPDAAAAGDAQVGIELHVRVGLIDPVGRPTVSRWGADPRLGAGSDEFTALGGQVQRPGRQRRDQELQSPPDGGGGDRVVGLDRHAVDDRGGAGGNHPGSDLVLHRYQTGPAGAAGRGPGVPAQGRDLTAGSMHGSQHRGSRRNLHVASVDGELHRRSSA